MRKEPDIDLSPTVSDVVKSTTCYICACRCGINVHLRDGRVRHIEDNRNHPVNKGALCGKGASGVMPLILLVIVAVAAPPLATLAAALAALSAAVGVGIERWLFFAESQHVSMLLYDRAE